MFEPCVWDQFCYVGLYVCMYMCVRACVNVSVFEAGLCIVFAVCRLSNDEE